MRRLAKRRSPRAELLTYPKLRFRFSDPGKFRSLLDSEGPPIARHSLNFELPLVVQILNSNFALHFILPPKGAVHKLRWGAVSIDNSDGGVQLEGKDETTKNYAGSCLIAVLYFAVSEKIKMVRPQVKEKPPTGTSNCPSKILRTSPVKLKKFNPI